MQTSRHTECFVRVLGGVLRVPNAAADVAVVGLVEGSLRPQWPPALALPGGLAALCERCWQQR